jgi:hypothetical protein
VDCDNGNKKALKQMLEYNIQDVIMLEEIYLTIRPWISNPPNLSVMVDNADGCPVCLGEYERIGIFYGQQRRYPEFRCKNCGAVFHKTKAIK